MKKILIYLCFLPCLLIGQELYLSEAITVSGEGTGYRAPRIALLDDGRPIVYWGKTGSDATLYLAIWNETGFGEPIALNTNSIQPDLWGGGLGPQITAAGNTFYIVFEAYGEGIYCIHSTDGGLTFSAPVSVYDFPDGRVATLPSVAIDPAGNPIVSFVTTNFGEQEALYEITRSLDGGNTFELSAVANIAAEGSEVCECCPASIGVASEEEIFLSFRNNNDNIRDFWIAKSTDGGDNFPEAVDIDITNWFIQACPQSGPDILVSGDSLFTVFFNGEGGSNIYLSAVDGTTMTLGNQYQIPSFGGEDRNQNYPSIAGSGDTLAVVWQESGTAGFDIMMAWSANGSGDLLDNFMVIDNDALTQKQPDIAYHNGVFHIVYEDQLNGRAAYRTASFEPISTVFDIPIKDFLIDIFPNPSTEKTLISFENEEQEEAMITLFNTMGQTVGVFQTNQAQLEIRADKLTSGTYFIRIEKAGQRSTARLVIE